MITTKTTKRASKVITAFYLLIVFEFIYMASPFALYFYSVYKPGLAAIGYFPGISWLTSFFLPHIAEETKSPVLNQLGLVGGVLLAGGLLIFIICAVQVYYSKIFRKGAVTGGLYKYIRHPQYTGFAISGLGMLLIWPRFLILITFITILFVYYFLAGIEENECETKFGESYMAFKSSTHMFLPFSLPLWRGFSIKKVVQPYRAIIFISGYLFALFISVILANEVRKLSVDRLFATYRENAVNLSVTKLSDDQLDGMVNLALSDSRVDSLMKPFETHPSSFFLNYILPADIFSISEIPMHIPDSLLYNLRTGSTGKKMYKVIIAKAIPDKNKPTTNRNVLLMTKYTKAIAEVWIDLNSLKITSVLFPDTKKRYDNIPVPVF